MVRKCCFRIEISKSCNWEKLIGLWQGSYLNNPEQLWLRWWDLDGNLLLVGKEEAKLQKFRAEQAENKAAKLAAKLREMGINPDDDL